MGTTSLKQGAKERDWSDKEPGKNKEGKRKVALRWSQPIRGPRRGHNSPSLAGTQQHSVFISPETKMSAEAADCRAACREAMSRDQEL